MNSPAILSGVSNHPNRNKRTPSAARNPRPEEIRAAREAAGLSQTEAAELIYCNLRTWQQWETETADPAQRRRMHAAFWELWQLKVKELPPRDR